MRKAEIISETSVKEWMIENNCVLAPDVRTNDNEYPFLTFVRKDAPKGQGGENVYFSVAAAEGVKEGDHVSSLGLQDFKIMELKYEDGSTRLKLTNKKGGYLDLDAIFG